MTTKNHLQAGFTLIEVAITLIILGILAGAALPSLIRYKQSTSLLQTKKNQEIVVQAVAAYELVNETLPCPADPNAIGQNKGISLLNCADSRSAIGIVPYRTLGISEEHARDGYKRYMTYVVPPREEKLKSVCSFKPSRPIIVKDENGSCVNPENNYIALLLIGHGPSGHGAFTGKDQNRVSNIDAGSKERKNADSSLTFYALPYNIGMDPFRHSVMYITRDTLRSVYAHHPCKYEEVNPAERQTFDPGYG